MNFLKPAINMLALLVHYNCAAERCDYQAAQCDNYHRQVGKAPNWKQCTWKDVNDGRDSGQVHECLFYKKRDDTFLRVVYQGNLRIACNNCCKRWYFTFNNQECSSPAPIDAVIYQIYASGSPNVHRPVTQEGYCGGISRGIVRVGFSVGNCKGHGNADAYTSWNSVSRIIIEEVEPPQA